MKSVIKKEFVRENAHVSVATEHADVPLPSSNERRPAPPGVRLVRVDGHVQAIEVTCRCGDTSVIEIDYESSPASIEGNQ